MAESPSPPVLLILGVDASGKDHVANVAVGALTAGGVPTVRRPGWLCARAVARRSSEDKGGARLAQERLFVATFPLLRPLVIPLCGALLSADVRRFRRSRGADGKTTVVVSHTPIRVLAFALGHRGDDEPLRVGRRTERALRELAGTDGLRVVVLDISAEVRAARLADRAMRGRLDHLDRYLANPAHTALAERIEATLVELAVRYLDATVVHNDGLDDDAIAAALQLRPPRPSRAPRPRGGASSRRRSVAGWRGDRYRAASV